MRKAKLSIIAMILISMVIPMLILGVVFFQKGIYIGSDNTILIMDMQAQYMPFYASLRYILNSDSSLFFSMFGGLGVNNFGNFAYYLTSPLAWSTVMVPLEYLPDAIYVIVLIKIGFCGAAFCFYLTYANRTEQHRVSVVLLSFCYALMSFNVAYSLNIMWLDGVIMLPLILVAIERALKQEKYGWLIISVSISLILNYYISFMSAVLSVIYAFIRLTELKKWNAKTILSGIFSVSLAAGISMPIVLPGVMAMAGGKLSEGEYKIKELFRYSIVDVLGQLISGRYDSVYDDGLPFIFCGTCTLVLVLIYFIKGRDSVKTRVMFAVAIVFYLFSMCFVPLDRVMHGMRETTCFEVRYGYAFSCLLLIVAYRGITPLTELLKRFKLGSAIKIVVALFVVIELYMNSFICVAGIMVEAHYKTRLEYDLSMQIKNILLDLIDDQGVYRISDTHSFTHNDGAWLGYNGFGYFSSCYNLNLMNYLGDLGENQIYHDLIDNRRTLLEEALLGAKYRLEYIPRDAAKHIIGQYGAYRLIQNDDALSLGYMANYNGADVAKISPNAFVNQNNLAKELSGINDDVFKEMKLDNYREIDDPDYAKYLTFETTVTQDAPVWIFFEWASNAERKEKDVNISDVNNPHFNGGIQEIKLIVNGDDYGPFLDDHSSFAIYLGRFSKGDVIDIEAKSMVYCGDVHVDYMDEDVYNRVIDRLSMNQYFISEHSDSHFKGIIDAGKGGNMFTSLPYMKGWKVEVDGREVKTTDYRNAFMVIPVLEGQHVVDMRFTPPGLIEGVIIGIVSFVLAVIWIYFCWNKMRAGGKEVVKEVEKV